jgi:hypothetical protein
MSQETIIANTEVSFKDFLFKNKRNRTILWIAGVAIVVQFGVFKYFYPFASFIHGDSFSYLKAADANLSINTYMIGYSKFLRLFSVFSTSDLALTAFQYLLIQSSTIFLLFSIFYFYPPTQLTQILLLIFFVFNPLLLHLSNLISSDCFFVALSVTWFTLLFWIIKRPTTFITICQISVLFLAFTVRYNALIYPFIAIAAYGMSKLSIVKKIVSISLGICVCGLFILFTCYKYKSLTGYYQYSPFSGWQLANNAMYAYRYVDKEDRKILPPKYRKLDKMIRDFFDSTRDTKKFPTEAFKASTFYMWSASMPLMKYRNLEFKNDTGATELKKWATMGPLFKSYGLYIIRLYPIYYLKHFIWPNALKYYAPPIEFLEKYNSGKNDVTELTKWWFKYKARNITTRMKDNSVWVLNFYPIFSGVTNVVLLISLICYLLLKGWQLNNSFKNLVLMGALLWVLNAAFTITASSAALRFQSFPILINAVFMALLIDWMAQLVKKETIINVQSEKVPFQAAI